MFLCREKTFRSNAKLLFHFSICLFDHMLSLLLVSIGKSCCLRGDRKNVLNVFRGQGVCSNVEVRAISGC